MCNKEQKGTVEILAEGCGCIMAPDMLEKMYAENEEENEEKADTAQTESEQVINCDFYKL